MTGLAAALTALAAVVVYFVVLVAVLRKGP